MAYAIAKTAQYTIIHWFLQLKPETWVRNGEDIASDYKHHCPLDERLETLAEIYAAAVKVYINDIVHALTMRSAVPVRLRYSMSLPAAF